MLKLLMLFVLILSTGLIEAANSENGAKLYKKCVSCHGKEGYGKKTQKATLIAGQYDWYLKSQITHIRDGVRVNKNTKKMYPFVKNLTDSEISDLAAYVSTLQKKQ